ncbi:MAG: ribonuclease P protein component, partial [Clostridiales bacterium]|nr:ribonuclease P protein component [Clostridiales bacterium]
ENLFKKGIDIVIVARVNIRGKSFSEVNSAVLHLGKLHRILENGKDGC